ncbi:MAG: DUF362 domain-containing protein [Gemmatales bacterium]
MATLAPVDVLQECESFLLRVQNTDGGWGYAEGLPSQPEPTSLAILALAKKPEHRSTCNKACQFLASLQDSRGAIRPPTSFEKSYWPTGLAIIALHQMQPDNPVINKALGWLFSQRTMTRAMNDDMARDFEIDTTLVGWSWTEDTFSWVDPTSWVILALRHTGHADHPRTHEGLKLLLDRAYPEGGANCGNRRIYGSRTEPVPANTCSLLLAHSGLADDPKLAASRQYLRDSITRHADLENLCWTRLALDAWQSEPATAEVLPGLEARILELFAEQTQANRVFRRSTIRQALTLLALSTREYHPLLPRGNEPKLAADDRVKPNKPGFLERLSKSFKGVMISAAGQLRALPDATSVHIAVAKSYDDDLISIVSQMYESFRDQVPLKDKRVVLKPNLVEYHVNRVINTNPRVIGAVIALCQKEGAKEVIVAEGPGHWRNVEYLVTASGLRDVLTKYGVPFIDVNSDRVVEKVNLGMLTGMHQLYFSATVAEADVLISMPKFKTHHWAGVTLSLKNLFGTLPGVCYGWPKNELHHRGIENSIVDIALTRTPELAIVDGIIGMEGDGPLNGQAREMGALIMGNDPLAVDATCARMMGFRAEKIGHLQLGANRRLGHIDASRIRQLGVSIESVKQHFVPPPKLESIVEG